MSVFSTSLILALIYATTIGLYSQSLLKNVDQELFKSAYRLKQRLNFDRNGNLDRFTQADQSILAQGLSRPLMYIIRDQKFHPIKRSASMIYIEIPIDQPKSDYVNFDFAGNEYRLFTEKFEASSHSGNTDLYIQVIQSLQDYKQQVYQLLRAMLWLVPVSLILIAIISWWIADRALKPLSRLSNTLININTKQLDERVSVENVNDEVGKIALATNDFLHRIENAFSSLRRFTSDASHELRTPLTTIRTQVEVVLSRERTNEEYKQVLGSVLEEVDRLEYLSEALLQLTRGDAGIIKINRTATDLSLLLKTWVENLQTLAEEKHIKFETAIQSQVMFEADVAIIERVFINIIQNAIAYTPVNGLIKIHLERQDDRVVFQVSDSGPGIADEDKQTIFQRFARLDATRQLASGAGLGLAIAKWALELHGGEIEVTDNKPNGTVFTVTLPV